MLREPLYFWKIVVRLFLAERTYAQAVQCKKILGPLWRCIHSMSWNLFNYRNCQIPFHTMILNSEIHIMPTVWSSVKISGSYTEHWLSAPSFVSLFAKLQLLVYDLCCNTHDMVPNDGVVLLFPMWIQLLRRYCTPNVERQQCRTSDKTSQIVSSEIGGLNVLLRYNDLRICLWFSFS